MGAALRHKPIAAPSAKQEAACEMAWLLGQPHLSDYLEFVAHKVVGGRGADPRKLTEEWRAANDLYYDLEQSEAGIAEEVECLPLDGALQPLVDAVCASPWFRASFDNLPFTFARVELDKLVVSQNSVEHSFTDRLAATLRERRSAAREVRSLTAQARLSGAILGLLPIAFFTFLALTSRRDLDAALATSTGRTAIIAGLAMQAAAFAWIRSLLRVA